MKYKINKIGKTTDVRRTVPVKEKLEIDDCRC